MKIDKDYIFSELNKDYQYIKTVYPKLDIIGIFAYGSMNKGTWYKNSDVDFICLVNSATPFTLFQQIPNSNIFYFLYDINTYLQGLQQANAVFFNTIEPLFTEYRILNSKYENLFNIWNGQREKYVIANKLRLAKGFINSMEHHYNYATQFLINKPNTTEYEWYKLYYHIIFVIDLFNILYRYKSWNININIPRQEMIDIKLGKVYTAAEIKDLIFNIVPQQIQSLKMQLQFFNNTINSQDWIDFFNNQKEQYQLLLQKGEK